MRAACHLLRGRRRTNTVNGLGAAFPVAARARRELNDLRQQLRELARSDLPVVEIQSTAESMMSDVANVLAAQLHLRAKVRCDHDVQRRPERARDHHAPRQADSAPDRHGHDRA